MVAEGGCGLEGGDAGCVFALEGGKGGCLVGAAGFAFLVVGFDGGVGEEGGGDEEGCHCLFEVGVKGVCWGLAVGCIGVSGGGRMCVCVYTLGVVV